MYFVYNQGWVKVSDGLKKQLDCQVFGDKLRWNSNFHPTVIKAARCRKREFLRWTLSNWLLFQLRHIYIYWVVEKVLTIFKPKLRQTFSIFWEEFNSIQWTSAIFWLHNNPVAVEFLWFLDENDRKWFLRSSIEAKWIPLRMLCRNSYRWYSDAAKSGLHG